MPPKTRRLSLKDVVSKMNTKGGGDGSQGLTLSESIRNSGKVLEEHEMKIRQLNNLTEALTNTVRTKDEAMLAMQAAMQDKLDKKSKDVEHLQSTARASEMAIRGLEDEVRLLRKQNNEVDKVFRAQAGKGPPVPESERKPSPPLTRKPSAPGGDDSRPATRDVDAGVEALQGQLRAAELLIKHQKKEIEAGEAKALGLRGQVADITNKNTLLAKEKVAAERVAKDKAAELEKLAKEKAAEARKLQDIIDKLQREIAALKAKPEPPSVKAKPEPPKGSDDSAAIKALEEKLAQVGKDLIKEKSAREKATAAQKAAEQDAKESQGKAIKAQEELKAAAKKAAEEAAALQESEQKALKQVTKLQEEASLQELKIAALEKRIKELEEALQVALQVPEVEGGGEELAALHGEVARLKKRVELLEAEARMLATKHKEEIGARDLTINEREATIAALRLELDRLREDSKQSLAHLCRIRELEQEVREQGVLAAEARMALDAARKYSTEMGDKVRDLERAAEKDAAVQARLEKELKQLQDELLRLKADHQGQSKEDEKRKQGEAEEKAQRTALHLQVHKLQMLLRMAEITKLEEHIKCSRRADAFKEEKVGLLTYNLASAESQIDLANTAASQKRQQVREERLAVLNKKQKLEEDKMKTNEESYSTQSTRLKEKLRELEKKVKDTGEPRS